MPERVVGEIKPIKVDQKVRPCCPFDPYNHGVVDLDLRTKAGADADDTGPAWLKLEFGKVQFILNVIFYVRFYTNWFNPQDTCTSSDMNKWRSCMDAISGISVSVYRGEVKQKSCGTLQITYGLEQSDQIYTLTCGAIGDTVKLTKAEGKLRAWEIVVIGMGK